VWKKKRKEQTSSREDRGVLSTSPVQECRSAADRQKKKEGKEGREPEEPRIPLNENLES